MVPAGRLAYCVTMWKTSDILWQDTQHQVLFEILDLIREPEAEAGIIRRLRDYTENHFALEERYMEELDYPQRDDEAWLKHTRCGRRKDLTRR